MGVIERRARHKEALRQQILDAAREVFVTEGYESVSMRKIADKIEYSPTTIYLYFKDKAELLNCLCEEILMRLGQEIEKTPPAPEPIAQLKQGMRVYINFGVNNPHDYRVAFMTSPRADPSQRPVSRRVFGYLRQDVARCIEAGKFRPVDLEMAAQVLWSAAHGITSLMVTHPGFPWVDQERVIDEAIDNAVRGLIACPDPA
ncbi:MAG: TetR/AcrR family transcriptional regulator [Acidobacteriota bacterium]